MNKSQESDARRKARLEKIKCLRTHVVESKKLYNRKKVKAAIHKGELNE